jgi:hypothetical protein
MFFSSKVKLPVKEYTQPGVLPQSNCLIYVLCWSTILFGVVQVGCGRESPECLYNEHKNLQLFICSSLGRGRL